VTHRSCFCPGSAIAEIRKKAIGIKLNGKILFTTAVDGLGSMGERYLRNVDAGVLSRLKLFFCFFFVTP